MISVARVGVFVKRAFGIHHRWTDHHVRSPKQLRTASRLFVSRLKLTRSHRQGGKIRAIIFIIRCKFSGTISKQSTV